VSRSYHPHIAPFVLTHSGAVGLEVLGSHARNLYGRQWDKLLAVIYEGISVGVDGTGSNGNSLIGGSSPEGIAARVRVQLEVEKIMRGS